MVLPRLSPFFVVLRSTDRWETANRYPKPFFRLRISNAVEGGLGATAPGIHRPGWMKIGPGAYRASSERRSSMRYLVVAASVAVLGCMAGDLDLGPVDRTAPPRVEAIRPPKDDAGVPRVGLRAEVSGEIKGERARHLYVLVNPLSNPHNFNQWWIQQPVSFSGNRLSCEIQCGEGNAGTNEFFCVVAIWSDTEYSVGERLERLPKAAAYSKALIVKRD
jgi:hypothetical protein